MPAAADPRRVRLKPAQRARQIQRPPATATFAKVIAAAATAADPAAIPLTPCRTDRDDHLSLAARHDILNHRSVQPEQPRPYPDTAHVPVACSSSDREEAGNPRSDGACAPFSAAHQTH